MLTKKTMKISSKMINMSLTTVKSCLHLHAEAAATNKTVSAGSTNLRTAVFCRHDLDLGPLTLKLYQGIDILKLYRLTKNEVAMSSRSKVIA